MVATTNQSQAGAVTLAVRCLGGPCSDLFDFNLAGFCRSRDFLGTSRELTLPLGIEYKQ